jgi:hypothetical protein
MVNAHFKCRFIPQLKGLIDVINYWNWEDKERVKRRDVGSIQTRTPFGYWVIIGAVDLGFRSGLYVWKAKT